MLEQLLENRLILVTGILSILTTLGLAIWYFIELSIARRKALKQDGFVMQIIPPKYSTTDIKTKQGERFSLQRFVDNLTASAKNNRISFEIYADSDGIKFLVWTPTKQIQDLIKLNLYSTYKERVKIKTLEIDPLKNFSPKESTINEYKSLKHDVYMLMDVRDFESMDPVTDILTSMTNMDADTKMLFQLVLSPSKIDKEALRMAKENFRLLRSEITWFSVFLNHFEAYLLYFIPLLPFLIFKALSEISRSFSSRLENIDPMVLLADQDPRKILVDKDSLQNFFSLMDEKYKTSFTTYIRVIAQGSQKEEKLNGFEQALESMKSETQNRLVRKSSSKSSDLQQRFIYPESNIFPFYRELFTSQGALSSREISMIYHLPNKILDPVIEHFVSPDIPVKKEYRSKHLNFDLKLGINNTHEKQYSVYLPTENRKRHLVVTGQTGTGKSTILKNFILQDIDNNLLKGEKRGLILMDPHEDFFMDLLKRLPETYKDSKKLIAWDTQSEEWYFGFNPIYAVGMTEREIDLTIDSNFKLIEKIVKRSNPDVGMGMTGKPMLLNAMKTLMVFQNEWIARHYGTEDAINLMSNLAPTLLDVRTLLFDEKFSEVIRSFITLDKYEGLRTFWNVTLPNYRKSQNWAEIQQGFDNKLSQVLTGILMYTFGQSKSSVNIADVIRKSKILLVNLSSKNIGEEGMSLLGSLLISKIWFESKRIAENERKPFVVYADEFQNFASSDFSQALSEARKFKLELILAHQFFQQLPDDVFHAVMGNVKNKIYYRCGLEDSQIVSKDLQGKVLEQEVMEVPEFYANIKAGEDVFSVYVPKEREVTISQNDVTSLIDFNYKTLGKSKDKIDSEITNRRNWILKGCELDVTTWSLGELNQIASRVEVI